MEKLDSQAKNSLENVAAAQTFMLASYPLCPQTKTLKPAI
jgi:hypothetical protein